MITTLDGIIANGLPTQALLKVGGTMEAAGVLHSMFYSTGLPGAAAAPSPGLSGAALTSYAGQIPLGSRAILARLLVTWRAEDYGAGREQRALSQTMGVVKP